MNRLEALYAATDVREVIGDHEAPFNVLEATVNETGARVTLSHRTDLEPMSMTGEVNRTNGETDGRLLFDAYREALGTPEALSSMYLNEFHDTETGSFELRTFGPHGEVFSAVAPTPQEAVDMTFKAVSVYQV